jgi:hypothetical protein
MVARVIRGVVLIVLTGSILSGCGRQVARDPSQDPDLLATGPASEPIMAPRPFVAASIEAVGGLSAWTRCRRLDFDAIVTAHHPDGGLYLTEHRFSLFPWSDAIQVTAGEPRARLAWQVVRGQYSLDCDPTLDISPLSGLYRAYAEAVLQIVTAPARMLEPSVTLTRKPMPVQIAGQWYQPIEAKFGPQEVVSGDNRRKQVTVVEPYWTQGIYFQNHGRLVVDMIWLTNPLAQKSLLVRGYDYTYVAGGEVLIPTQIEIFQSDSEARFGPRMALIDLKR